MSFTRGKGRWRSHEKKSKGVEKRGVFIPKSYQKECIRKGVASPAAGFLLAPGLGKTSIILHIFKILKKLGYVDALFVLAKKKIVYNVWKQEIKKWSLPFRSTILHGGKKDKRLRSQRDVYLMNYEGLPWFMTNKKRFFGRGKGYSRRVMLACDESSKLRNTSTVRFKKLKKLLPHFARRYILTGSPVPKGLMNLFGQIYVLDLGESLGKYITHFRNEYFEPAGYMGYDWKLQKGAKKRIYRKISHLVVRYGHDQLDLPPCTPIYKHFDLPKKARRVYDEMEKEFVVELKGSEITAANAAVASGKCRQIANGGLYYDEEGGHSYSRDAKRQRRFKTVHTEKEEALVDLLEELEGEPALVGFEYHHDKARIQRYLARHAPQFAEAPFVDGGLKPKAERKLLKAWDRGDIPVMFGQIGATAYGLNLQGKGGIVIYYSLTWNLEDYEQFYQRVWRQGQERRVLVYHLVARDTVDELMIGRLGKADRQQQSFLKAMEKKYGFQQKERREKVRAEYRRGSSEVSQSR
jgi:SNF2 family DNA or RNA helicase